MAVISLYTQNNNEFDLQVIEYSGSVVDWVLKNIEKGQNFSIYNGGLNKKNEISRDYKAVASADDVSVFILPASGIEIGYVIAAVLVVAALSVKPVALPNLNRTQESPNNSLTDRRNKARPNQRIVDICGKVKSIPDVLSREYTRYVDDIEERVGYYCVARKNVSIDEIKEGDTLISDIENASAGVYGKNKSPNNSAPHMQIGEPINENVYGVTQSPEAIGQTLLAENQNTLVLSADFSASASGVITCNDDVTDFRENFEVGDNLSLNDIYISVIVESLPTNFQIGANTNLVLSVAKKSITFDISNDDSWALIDPSPSNIVNSFSPNLSQLQDVVIGPFKMSTIKINRLLVNVNALNGIYKEDDEGRRKTTTRYKVTYQKLDDFGEPIGNATVVNQEISGNSTSEKGNTTDIDLGGDTFVQWSIQRTSPVDFNFQGNVIDEIKLRSVFGLSNTNKEHFGDVTTIQTKRTNEFLSTSTKTPELNCIATELTKKYIGNGDFDTEYTENTQAMQSLIRLALDPYVGRRSQTELDLDNLLLAQEDCETYFNSDLAGQFNYSFDSSSLSAQEIFLSIGKAAFITLWREGRILKGSVEKPQSIPSMVFTHRSKEPNNETWSRKRNTSESKDSIELTYTDDSLFTKETLYYPDDRSGTNPERIEITGVKGEQQAYWHMMRLFNKQKYQEISVDFGATQEGKFVKPNKLISVVKGSRVFTYDGYISNVDGLFLTLSQDVLFTDGDSHSIILKNRDGSTESIAVVETETTKIVKLLLPPTNEIYTGNDQLKTEFSFGNEARLTAQLMLPEEIAPNGKSYVKIKAVNYSPLYYQNDTTQPSKAFSNGFDDGFS